MMDFRVIGTGRAGRSFQIALSESGWRCLETLGRHDDHAMAAHEVDLVIIAVPDHAIAEVAAAVTPGQAAVMHLSGTKPLAELAPHVRRASVHPLISLPDPETGSKRLTEGATFAVAGDPVAARLVEALGGRAIEVDERLRPLYHAAASVGANHLVALCAQVERLAAEAGVPVDAYWDLMVRTLENVRASGAASAITGPAARGDLATIASHLKVIDPEEHRLYLALADAAAELAGQPKPSKEFDKPKRRFGG